MTARDSYNQTVSNAELTKAAALAAGEMARQVAIDAVSSVVGTNLALGASSSQIAAVKSANNAKLASVNAAEAAKQASIAVARDTLRNAGADSNPF